MDPRATRVSRGLLAPPDPPDHRVIRASWGLLARKDLVAFQALPIRKVQEAQQVLLALLAPQALPVLLALPASAWDSRAKLPSQAPP